MTQSTDIHVHELDNASYDEFTSSGYSALHLPLAGESYGGVSLYFHGATAGVLKALFAPSKPDHSPLLAQLRSLKSEHYNHLHLVSTINDAIAALS